MPVLSEAASAALPPSSRPGRALAALLLLIPFPSLGTAAATFWWPGTWAGTGLFAFSKIWIILFPALWLLAVERGRLSCSPARQGGFPIAALLGLVLGLAIVAGFLIVNRAGGIDATLVVQHAQRTGLGSLPVYVAGALYWITINSLLEEYVWRWFVFRQFEVLIGAPAAIVASGLAFTAHHVIALAGQFSWPITLIGSFGVFTGGLVWSWLYSRYRSVWPGYLSHAIVDVPIFVIGYYLIFRSTG